MSGGRVLMKKQPEKTARTKQSIIDAYWEIAKEQGVRNVTVNAVALTAGLNRATFYVYFTDLDDLLYQAEEQVLEVLLQKMSAVLEHGLPDDISKAAVSVLEVLVEYNDKLFLLLGRNGDPNFVSLFRETASKLFELVFKSQTASAYQEYVVAYVSSAFIGLICYWNESGKKISIEELASICRSLTLGGLVNFRDSENCGFLI